jgi:CheY-like chemotaxis protein
MYNQHHYLYVEDDPLSREIMQMIMTNLLGIEHLSMFEDSQNFAARLGALPRRPDVILLDIHMKPHTGFEMLDMLRHDLGYEQATIVALTASVMNEEVQKLQTSGFDGAIGKPISLQTFPDLLARILEGERVWHVADQ